MFVLTQMAKNLKVTHFNNGDEIPDLEYNTDWINTNYSAYSDYYNDPANSAIYGRLYNWYTIDDNRAVCPEYWHMPSDE